MRGRKIVGPLTVLAALALSSVGAVQAQEPLPAPTSVKPDATVRLTPAQAGVFRDALAALAQQGHVTILAEGAPLHPKLVPKDAPALPQNTPLEDAVQQVAAAYDYDAERNMERKGKIFLLRKRYTDPNDLPCVTLEECARTMQDVVRVMSPFAPDTRFPPQGDVYHDSTRVLIQSLTPEQKLAVPKGLPISSLTPEQQTKIWNFALYFPVTRPFQAAQNADFFLRQAPQAFVGLDTMQWLDRGGASHPIAFFGWGWAKPDASGHIPLLPFGVAVATMLDGRADPRTSPPAPTPEQKAAFKAGVEEAKQDGHATLKEEVAVLSERAAHDTHVPRLKVDAMLAAKPVTVAGGEGAAPKDVFYALAALYGLHVVTDDDGALLLTRRPVVTPFDFAALWPDVLGALPDPLLRAAHPDAALALRRQADDASRAVKEQDEALNALRAASDAQTGAERQKTLDLIRQKEGEQQQALQRLIHIPNQQAEDTTLPARLRQAALERLRAAVDAFPAQGRVGGDVPLAAMSETDRAALGVALMTDFMNASRGYSDRPPPEYVTRFNEYVLTGGVSNRQGHPVFHLQMKRPKEDGSGYVEGPGFFDPNYVPPPGQDSPPPVVSQTDPAPAGAE